MVAIQQMFYRPMKVEMVQWDGDNFNELKAFFPDIDRIRQDVIQVRGLHHLLSVGDYLVKDLFGNVSVCQESQRDKIYAKGMVFVQGETISYKEVTKRYLTHILHVYDGNVSNAAKMSGIHRATFYNMIRRFRLYNERERLLTNRKKDDLAKKLQKAQEKAQLEMEKFEEKQAIERKLWKNPKPAGGEK